MRDMRRFAATLAALAGTWMGAAGAVETKGALYGDLRISFDYADDDSGIAGPTYSVTDNNSAWGVKASTTKGGVTVFGGYERYISDDEPALPGFPVELTRESYLGITSFCGTVKLGRHRTAYADAGRKLDPFYNTAVSGAGGLAAAGSIFAGGNSHGTSTAFNGDAFGEAYVANHLSYQSPVYFGFTGNAAFFVHETNDANQDHDYGVGVEYAGSERTAGLTAGLQYLDANGANGATWGTGVEALRLYAGYAQERYGLGLSYEKLAVSVGNDATFLMLSGWYGFRDDTRIAASFGTEDESASAGTSVRIGLFHDLLDSFTVWAAARTYSGDAGALPDADVFSLGASYKFSLGFGS
jgi:predicted porin